MGSWSTTEVMMKIGTNKAQKPEGIIHESIDRELYIDINNINDELMDQPLLYRKYTQLKSNSFRNLSALKNKLEQIEATARLEFKKTHNKSTVAELDAMIALDPSVRDVQDQYLNAQEDFDNLEGIVYALRQRHEAIKELAANLRKEMAD
jgi:hypothetical protein